MIEGAQTNFIKRLKLSHRRRRNKAQSAIHNDDCQCTSTSRLYKLCFQQLLMLADDSCITSADHNLSYMQSQVCFAFAPHSASITTTTINIFVIIVIISSIIIVNSLRKRRHFATPSLVSLRNDVSRTSAEIPY